MSRIINVFFHLMVQIKLYHFQTNSFSRHTASDKLFESIIDLTDKFIEVYIAKYGKPKINETNSNIKIMNMNDNQIIHFLKKNIDFLTKDLSKLIDTDNDTDLMTIRDEILLNINQTLYLFTLN
jgi:hypothetical protein